MPFKSDKQRRFMYANHPEIAKRWSEEEKKMGKKKPAMTETEKRRRADPAAEARRVDEWMAKRAKQMQAGKKKPSPPSKAQIQKQQVRQAQEQRSRSWGWGNLLDAYQGKLKKKKP